MLSLNNQQMAALDGAQQRQFRLALVASLRSGLDLFSEVHPLIVHSLCSNALTRAAQYGLSTQADLALFVQLMARVSPTFDLQPEVHAALIRTDLHADNRMTVLMRDADELTWSQAGEDDSTLGWYLQFDSFGLEPETRLAAALASALPPEDLEADPARRTALVAEATRTARQLGFIGPTPHWIWCACALAYGQDFHQQAAWAADVFDADHSQPEQIGMLRVRLAIDFGAWL